MAWLELEKKKEKEGKKGGERKGKKWKWKREISKLSACTDFSLVRDELKLYLIILLHFFAYNLQLFQILLTRNCISLWLWIKLFFFNFRFLTKVKWQRIGLNIRKIFLIKPHGYTFFFDSFFFFFISVSKFFPYIYINVIDLIFLIKIFNIKMSLLKLKNKLIVTTV